MYIDRLLDSTIPHELLNEYADQLEASAYRPVDVPDTIPEDDSQPKDSPGPTRPETAVSASASASASVSQSGSGSLSYGTTTPNGSTKVGLPQKRSPRDIFRSSENLPLLAHPEMQGDDEDEIEAAANDATATPGTASDAGPRPNLPWLEDIELDSDSPVVTFAIWINMIANIVLLIGKLIVVFSVPSMSVLASLVDAVLDFLSTAIVWTTTRLISSSQQDQHSYPVGRRRLEPVGVLVFSVIMITSFFQVGSESVQRLAGSDHSFIQMTIPAIGIMVGTIVIKGAAFIWCRLVNNSSVRALLVPLLLLLPPQDIMLTPKTQSGRCQDRHCVQRGLYFLPDW